MTKSVLFTALTGRFMERRNIMAYKVLVINGSPKANGCTAAALDEVIRTLNQEGIETTLLQIGKEAVMRRRRAREPDQRWKKEDQRTSARRDGEIPTGTLVNRKKNVYNKAFLSAGRAGQKIRADG